MSTKYTLCSIYYITQCLTEDNKVKAIQVQAISVDVVSLSRQLLGFCDLSYQKVFYQKCSFIKFSKREIYPRSIVQTWLKDPSLHAVDIIRVGQGVAGGCSPFSWRGICYFRSIFLKEQKETLLTALQIALLSLAESL